MSDEGQVGNEEGTEPGTNGAGSASSLIDRIHEERRARMQDERLRLPIPTWGGDLVARYKVVDRRQIESMAERAQGKKAADSGADIDFLARACDGVFARKEDGQLEEITDEHGLSVGFDERLAEKLGLEFERAREVVSYLFGGNAIAIASMAIKIATWMQDTSQEVDGAIMGESATAVTSS